MNGLSRRASHMNHFLEEPSSKSISFKMGPRWGLITEGRPTRFLRKLNQISARYGLDSVAWSLRLDQKDSKLLKGLVPGAGVEPAPSYEERILRTLPRVPRSLTKRYEPVFTRLAVVKVSLRLATYQHVRPPSWPHLLRRGKAVPPRSIYRKFVPVLLIKYRRAVPEALPA
jgi:hypothetical protein